MHLSTNASTSKHMDWMEERIALRGHRLSQGSQQRENLPAGVPVLTGTGNDGITHSQQPQQCRQLHACHCTVVWVHHNPTPFFVLLTWLIVVSLYASFLPKWPSRGREACSPISLAGPFPLLLVRRRRDQGNRCARLRRFHRFQQARPSFHTPD